MQRYSYTNVVQTAQGYQIEEEHQIAVQRIGGNGSSNSGSSGGDWEGAYNEDNHGILSLGSEPTQIKNNYGTVCGGGGPVKIYNNQGTLAAGGGHSMVDCNRGSIAAGGGTVWINDNYGTVAGGGGPVHIERNYGIVVRGCGPIRIVQDFGGTSSGGGGGRYNFESFSFNFGQRFGGNISSPEEAPRPKQLMLTDGKSEDGGNDPSTDEEQEGSARTRPRRPQAVPENEGNVEGGGEGLGEENWLNY